MSVRLFVGNLPYDVTENELREFFAPVGRVSRVFLPLDRESGKQRGFAFVELGSAEEADDAIRRLNSQSFKGRPIAVKEARERESRPGGNSDRPRPSGFAPRPSPSYQPQDVRSRPVIPSDNGGDAGRRRARSFNSARPDRKRRVQTRPHKSEWGKKAFLRSRKEDDYEEDLEVLNYGEEPDEKPAVVLNYEDDEHESSQ
jgi:RNA recognition motif-containing protein